MAYDKIQQFYPSVARTFIKEYISEWKKVQEIQWIYTLTKISRLQLIYTNIYRLFLTAEKLRLLRLLLLSAVQADSTAKKLSIG